MFQQASFRWTRSRLIVGTLSKKIALQRRLDKQHCVRAIGSFAGSQQQATNNYKSTLLDSRVAIAMGVGAATVATALAFSKDDDHDSQLMMMIQKKQQQPSLCLCEAPHNKKKKQDSFQVKEVYDIEQVLGEGAYGMVYQARRKADGLVVALKTMPREYTGQTDFEREVAALQLLSKPPGGPHDHVVKLYDLHRDDKNYYLAMELVQGGELLEHLIQHGPYSEGLAASFMRQFAEALCFVHSSGYVHSDLKPENLMLATSSAVVPAEGAMVVAGDNHTNNDHDDKSMPVALKVVDFGCVCTHDMGKKDLHLPANEFAAGCSFLHQVALGNQFELARILQERPSVVNFRDYDKRTALHIAASEGHLDICRFLVSRGARINRVDRWGGSPLDDAHRHGHAEVLQFLGQHGATFGSTAMAIDKFINAASQGDADQVKALLQFGNLDVNEGDYDRRTALHLAAGEGQLAIVKLLCEAGANVNVEDRWGNRPVNDAKSADKNSAAILEILEQYGGDATASSSMTKQEEQGGSILKNKMKDEPVSGTIAYWAPELFAKGAKPTPAIDMWAAGVIVYILLTGSHPFDKYADKTDEEIAQSLIQASSSSNATKNDDGDEQSVDFMDQVVFDERVQDLSESCIDLMRKLMHPDPEKRMTSDDFRRHPWVQGLTASWKTMNKTHAELEAYWQNRFRTEILKSFSGKLGIRSNNGETTNISEKDLQTMFRALDLKQNGVLELEEIASVLREVGASDSHIRQIFASADLDGTGVIRWDEFHALMTKEGLGEKHEDISGPGLQVSYLRNRFKSHIFHRFGSNQADATSDKGKLREIFNAIDLEGNGVLDPHEIRVVLRSAGEQEDVISRIVASLDVNRDGGVDWSEFQEIMGRTGDDSC